MHAQVTSAEKPAVAPPASDVDGVTCMQHSVRMQKLQMAVRASASSFALQCVKGHYFKTNLCKVDSCLLLIHANSM
jgi:hypothetical protein